MSQNKNRFFVSFGILLSRVSGYFRDMTLAYFFGANSVTDAFFLAFMIPNLLRSLLAEGILSSAFIPVFSDELHKDKDTAQILINKIFTLLLLTTIILTILGFFFSGPIVNLMGYGFKNNITRILAAKLLKKMFVLIVFISLAAICMAILNCINKFFIPAFAPLLMNLSIIITIILYYKSYGKIAEDKIYLGAIGVVIGSILQFLIQYIFVLKNKFKLSLDFNFNYPPLKKILKLMIPGIPGLAITELNVIIDRFIASFLITGSITYLFYSNRLFQFPLALFSTAAAIVLLPSISKSAAKNDIKSMLIKYYDSIEFMVYFIIPISLILIFAGDDILKLLFKHGNFNDTAVKQTYIALVCYVLGLCGYSLVKITTQIFYALKDTMTPVKISAIAMLTNITFNIILVKIWPNKNTQFAGIALATSISGYTYFILLWYFFNKNYKKQNLRLSFNKIKKHLIKVIISSSFIPIIIILIKKYFINLNLIYSVILTLSSSSLIYFTITLILRVDISEKIMYTSKRYLYKK